MSPNTHEEYWNLRRNEISREYVHICESPHVSNQLTHAFLDRWKNRNEKLLTTLEYRKVLRTCSLRAIEVPFCHLKKKRIQFKTNQESIGKINAIRKKKDFCFYGELIIKEFEIYKFQLLFKNSQKKNTVFGCFLKILWNIFFNNEL